MRSRWKVRLERVSVRRQKIEMFQGANRNLNIFKRPALSGHCPDMSLIWFLNPLNSIKYLICTRYKWFIIKIVIKIPRTLYSRIVSTISR
ncbi:hypothetical protein llap_4265 [Limosa lapponica baueri]|uniref:Uncharacterized protein n=1 Tax=Limosa lapponica baueri TaxID=1758121 RepID=A0A2I0UHC0_LIMLA|nr:hypothetical protein llap_4265 [Limosa lapponica baueri]